MAQSIFFSRRESVIPPNRIFVSAGEASGDLYGSLLIEALRHQIAEIEFFGCGGEKMRATGCQTLVDAGEVAMVGLLEVLPGLPRAWRALQNLTQALQDRPPDLAILIDFPDFNLRLAKTLQRIGRPVVYFVAPQVWAWRRGRLKTLRRYVDRLLCIFPFEESFFQEAGIQAEFIGHPLVGRVNPRLTRKEFQARFDLPGDRSWIALLPGSRRREIMLNLPAMVETAREIARRRQCCFLIPSASTAKGGWLRDFVAKAELPAIVLENHAYDALAYAEAAIVASGTATIEAALLGTPMVVVYRVSNATWRLGKWLVQTPFYSMVNLVAGREIVPEFIQDRFQPEAVAQEILQLLESRAMRTRMAEGLKEVCEKLHPPTRQGSPGPPNMDNLPGFHVMKNTDAIQRAAVIVESILREIVPNQVRSVGSY